MLTHLHVKNLAIVEEVQVDFTDQLNILTGETGVGKSIIIGSINIALGGKVSADMIRTGAEYALVEMIFSPESGIWQQLEQYDIYPEEGLLIISRKIMSGRSVVRVNGEIVTVAVLRAISSLLIDMHGQHEHQSLLNNDKHLEIIDRYAREKTEPLKDDIHKLYSDYCSLKKELLSMEVSDDERQREIAFIEYQLNEIETAAIGPDEESELSIEYRRLSNAEKIAENVGYVYSLTGEGNMCAADLIGNALGKLNEVSEYDSAIDDYASVLADIENILSDFNHDIASYMSEYSFDEQRMKETEERLDYVRKILAKYGGSTESMQQYYNEINDKLSKLKSFEEHKKGLQDQFERVDMQLKDKYAKLTRVRTIAADKLKVSIKNSLIDLNFLDVKFDISMTQLDSYSPNGIDSAEFMISTNPGEPVRPIARIASGGELSRIMLSIKSVLADNDSIQTLVFDEIDTGISGRTAQKVSEKLAQIADNHQVICITHLAQIAAMADTHYVIEKNVDSGRTRTDIRILGAEESEEELARILGGTVITDSVLNNAKEMKQLAREWKSK